MADFLLVLVLFAIYFLPAFVASGRKHLNQNSIGIMNLFTGWTFIGWVACLAWAFSSNTKTA